MNYLIHTYEHALNSHRYNLINLNLDLALGYDDEERQEITRKRITSFINRIDDDLIWKNNYLLNDYDDIKDFLYAENKIKFSKTKDHDPDKKLTYNLTKVGKGGIVLLKNFEAKIINQDLYSKIMNSEINIDHIAYIDDNPRIEAVAVKSKDGLYFQFVGNEIYYLRRKDKEWINYKHNNSSEIVAIKDMNISFDTFVNTQEFAKSINDENLAIFSGIKYIYKKTGKIYRVNVWKIIYVGDDEEEVISLSNVNGEPEIVVPISQFFNYFTLA